MKVTPVDAYPPSSPSPKFCPKVVQWFPAVRAAALQQQQQVFRDLTVPEILELRKPTFVRLKIASTAVRVIFAEVCPADRSLFKIHTER